MENSTAGFIRDIDCTVDTPVVLGKEDTPIYGNGKPVFPTVNGRKDSKHFEEIHLPCLLPLEEYDKIIVLFSGGKDSMAVYYKLRELGVPKEKIELFHHDIDGGNPQRRMDWRCTQNYVKAFAKAEGLKLNISYRKDGFFGELYRVGATKPVEWFDEEGNINHCKTSRMWELCEKIRKEHGEDMEEQLKQYGCRMKFPAKSGDLRVRWCSAYLKIMVADTVLSNLSETAKNCKCLVVSGERRGESVGRSKYNEMEVGRANAISKNNRLVHHWRPVIDYSEKDVWEVLKRHHVNPHPCYRAGWNRCSCAMCIFSRPSHFAGIRELYPEEYEALKQDEENLGFTLDNKCDLDTFVGDADSCVYHGDASALRSLITGKFPIEEVYVENWKYPAGAFHGAEGGPC